MSRSAIRFVPIKLYWNLNREVITGRYNIGEITMSPTYFVTIIISLVIPFSFGHICNITKIICCILKIHKKFGHFLYHHFHNLIFSSLQIYLTKIKSSFWTKCMAKRTLNHQFSAYITKILWTKDELSKCSGKNNKQTKMTRQKMEEDHNTNSLLSICWN